MGRPNTARALPAIRFRFTEEDDVKKYGEDWYVFSEGDVLRRRARLLVEIEGELGLPLVSAFNGFRASTVFGDMCAAWIGVRDKDAELAGPFDDFNPVVMSIQWEEAKPEGKAEAGQTATPEPVVSISRTEDPSGPQTSETIPLDLSHAMPVTESNAS